MAKQLPQHGLPARPGADSLGLQCQIWRVDGQVTRGVEGGRASEDAAARSRRLLGQAALQALQALCCIAAARLA